MFIVTVVDIIGLFGIVLLDICIGLVFDFAIVQRSIIEIFDLAIHG